jgi:hypothetical protein
MRGMGRLILPTYPNVNNVVLRKTMKKYRLAAKNIALTYPKCELEKEKVLEFLQCKLGGNLENYIISREKHLDGSSHIHGYISLIKVVNIQDVRYFDVEGHHGNYQSVKGRAN